MDMDLINDIESLRIDPATQGGEPASKELDRDAFLKIFLTQLESQDPLSPQDSSDLSAQLAQFSQLEQSVNTTSALEGISEKLDELIGITRGGDGLSRFDPVSLLGRRVEFTSDTLAVPIPGEEGEADLSTSLPSGSQALIVQVFDTQGDQSGVFSLTRTPPEPREVPDPSNPNGPPILVTPALPALPEGNYRLGFQNGQPVISGPGISGSAEFTRLSRVDGEFVRDLDAEGNPLPFRFSPGSSYRFALQAVNLSGGREPVELPTTRSAVASSVRVVDGETRILAGGTEVAPSDITQVLNTTR